MFFRSPIIFLSIISISRMKTNIFNTKKTLNLRGKLMDFSTCRLMGILNITPDSFYDGGRYAGEDTIKRRIKQMQEELVDIIDVGAYSSRPGATGISEREEMRRLKTALHLVRREAPDIPVSVDTFRSSVADFALKNYGVEIINDISGGEADEAMYEVVAKHRAAYVAMHMRGTPQNMNLRTEYKNMVADILLYFSEKVEQLKAKGINDFVIDPGFGFAKDLSQNYQLLSQLHLFQALETPILVGASRKSMIYKLLKTIPQEALNGTTAVHMLALCRGADILRVHDVKAAGECIAVYEQVKKSAQ